MHILKVHTIPTNLPDTFDVHWTNTIMQPRGVIRVKMASTIQDKAIAAELAALKHLMEIKEVLGSNVAGGNTMHLIVSHGAIRKLHLGKSCKGHLAPYANFLYTRFADCKPAVEKDTRWFTGHPIGTVEHLVVNKPQKETLFVNGLGHVGVTRHVMERYIGRFMPDADPAKLIREAWRKLVKVAGDPSLREVSRHSPFDYANANKQRHEGRYFQNQKCNLILVVANGPHGDPQLVTVYPATNQFRELPMAA